MSDTKPRKFVKSYGDRPAKPAPLGKRIRDIERLLKGRGDTLPAEIKEAKEKELEELKGQMKGKQQDIRANKFSAKYKMVRFLERKRVMKIESKLNKSIKTIEAKGNLTAEEKQQLSELKKDLKKANDDMTYVMHFPAHLKYISLFPKTPMTNERVLKLQASVREDLMKKKDLGELKDNEATMDVTEDLEENNEKPAKPATPAVEKAKPAAPKVNVEKKSEVKVVKAAPVKKENVAAKPAKDPKVKGSFQRPEDAMEKAPKKPAKKEKDAFFMGEEDDKKKDTKKESKKDTKKATPVKEEKKNKNKMDVKQEEKSSEDDASSDENNSDNENQEYAKGGKSSDESSSGSSSEESSSEEEKKPVNKKRKADSAELGTKQKSKKQKK